VVARLQTEEGRECVLVEVDPPVIGQPFGLGSKDLHSLILATRYKDVPFERVVNRPLYVLIYRILNPVEADQNVVRQSDMTMEAWGEVYPTFEDAERVWRKF
jgi:hypothetical protein